jgi:tetratricopeptide (TPR) repeat protein
MSKKRKVQLPKASVSTGLSVRAPSDPDRRAPVDSEDSQARAQRLVGEGARLLAAKRPGEAASKLDEAWELDPTNVAAAINLGGAYILQGKHERAIPALESATALEPDNPMIWTNLAAAYLGKLPFATRERQDRAIAAFERALVLRPHTPHVHYNLGLIYLERNDREQAIASFQAALETDPTDRDAQLWLERLHRGEDGAGKPQG